MSHKIISVVCAVVVLESHVLVAQRGPIKDRPGKWEFPGGKVDAGETEQEALVREIREELGIEIAPRRRLTPVTHHYSELSIELIPYLCTLVSGDIVLREHAAYRWCGIEELEALDWAEADRELVAGSWMLDAGIDEWDLW